MRRTETDILVVGGGIAGLAATGLFAAAGFSVLCVDPAAPPPSPGPSNGAGVAQPDLRSTAILLPGIDLLQRAGMWDRLAPHAAPLRVMRLLDAGGAQNTVRTRADFNAAELGQEVFGWNLPNWLLRREMAERLAGQAGVELRHTGFRGFLPRLDHALVRLTDGSSVVARLVVAADGRNSAVREALGISAPRIGYGQKAVVFAVAAEEPHDGVSTEIHRTGGPFTLVPLPDRAGIPHAAVVWMEDSARAAALARMPLADFEAALNARSCGVMGRLALAGPRALWPIHAQLARRFDGPRAALMGEAAHVMPPIGAQGLNTSLGDIDALAALVAEAHAAGRDIGAPGLLARYNRKRWPDAAARIAGVDFLNRAAQTRLQPLRNARQVGLTLLHGLTPLRRLALRAGLGVRNA